MADQVASTIQKTLLKLQSEKTRIDRQISALRAALTVLHDSAAPGVSRRAGRKPMSAASRKAIGKRMKAYWAKRRAGKATTSGKS